MIGVALPKSLSLAGLAGEARELLAWASGIGARGVQLDAAAEGMRPRELSRTARRDLAALLRRKELSFTGLDLWIPAAHFSDGARVDRAMEAVELAAAMCAEVGKLAGGTRLVVSIATAEGTSGEVLRRLLQTAQREGIEIADHAWPLREGNPLAIGLDPAAVFASGASPVAEAARLKAPIASARLSDLSADGRVAAGEGKLNIHEYEAVLASVGFQGPLVVDLRNVRNARQGAATLFGAG